METAPYSGNSKISSLHVLNSVGIPKAVISRSLDIPCENIPKNHTEPSASVLLLLMTSISVEIDNRPFFFSNVLLTVHLSIFMLLINKLDARKVFYNKFISCLYMFRAHGARKM